MFTCKYKRCGWYSLCSQRGEERGFCEKRKDFEAGRRYEEKERRYFLNKFQGALTEISETGCLNCDSKAIAKMALK